MIYCRIFMSRGQVCEGQSTCRLAGTIVSDDSVAPVKRVAGGASLLGGLDKKQ